MGTLYPRLRVSRGYFLVSHRLKEPQELLVKMRFDMQHGVFGCAVLLDIVCIEQDVGGQVLKVRS
jgi:hypothetical protein